MYFEIFHDSNIAESREKQIKKYRREKKVALFAKSNPRWKDLSGDVLGAIQEFLMWHHAAYEYVGFPLPLRGIRDKNK